MNFDGNPTDPSVPMQTKKQKPTHEVRLGHIKAAVWKNETEAGVRYNATFSRIYKDGDDWKSTDSFGRDDLLLLGKDGFRGLLGHCVEMSQLLRRKARDLPWLAVLNEDNHGAVVVIRVYPDGVDADTAYRTEKSDASQRDALLRHNGMTAVA